MNVLHQPLARRLSALLGAQVVFERLSLSLLGASLEAHGVSVAGPDPSRAVLTIARVRAEVSIGRALKGEIVIRSITVERPVLSIVQGVDGRTNWPGGIAPGSPDEPAGAEAEAQGREQAEPAAAAAKKWKLEVGRVLIQDGEARFGSGVGGGSYAASAQGIHAELAQQGNAFDLQLRIASVGRRDRGVELGSVKASGQLTGVSDLSRALEGAVAAEVEIGPMLRVQGRCPELSGRRVQGQVSGTVDLGVLLELLPPGAWTRPLRALRAAGRVQLEARGEHSPEGGLKIMELNLRGVDLSAAAAERSPDQP